MNEIILPAHFAFNNSMLINVQQYNNIERKYILRNKVHYTLKTKARFYFKPST